MSQNNMYGFCIIRGPNPIFSLHYRPYRPIIIITGRAKRHGQNRDYSMTTKKEQLELVKLELEVENLKREILFKDFKTKALTWGIFFAGLTLLLKLKGGA